MQNTYKVYKHTIPNGNGRYLEDKLWINQREALTFMRVHPACMMDIDMGCGKTLTTITHIITDESINKVMVVCPSKVIDVWREEFSKHVANYEEYIEIYDPTAKSITGAKKAQQLLEYYNKDIGKKFMFVVSYESVWRKPLSEVVKRFDFDTVILDESHRAKSAGSNTSKFLALMGKRVKKRICLSGTPMANSPLDIYGQYRFLDPSIFGTRHVDFLNEYAILDPGGRGFPIGYKNQDKLMEKYNRIAYTCKMADIKDRLKLPDKLPPVERYFSLPSKDKVMMKKLSKDFIASVNDKTLSIKNILEKRLRLSQIASGFCMVEDEILGTKSIEVLNTEKINLLADTLEDLKKDIPLVIFCVFKYDIDACIHLCKETQRKVFEMSGRVNQYKEWREQGGTLVVQIQSGAEGVNMTMASTAIYYSLPLSLALYEQSKARLYRPGQKNPVTFIHLIAKDTVDELTYKALINKRDLIDAIRKGEILIGFLK